MEYICILLLTCKRDPYMLHFSYREASSRACYQLESKYSMVIYGINFHLPPYEFEIGLYVNLEKLWNVKFQAK